MLLFGRVLAKATTKLKESFQLTRLFLKIRNIIIYIGTQSAIELTVTNHGLFLCCELSFHLLKNDKTSLALNKFASFRLKASTESFIGC